MNLLSAALFLGFVAIAGLCMSTRMAARFSKRTLANVFLAYVLIASFVPGIAQRDLWPFTWWKLIASRVPPTVDTKIGGHPRLVAIALDGTEHQLDFAAWEPIPPEELTSWAVHYFPQLDAAAQEQAFAYLLERVNLNAQRANGKYWRSTDRLGPISAPYFVLHPRMWSAPPEGAPFVGLRLYAESWNIQRRWRTGEPPRRKLAFEYRSDQ
jgi:hypothetical protein